MVHLLFEGFSDLKSSIPISGFRRPIAVHSSTYISFRARAGNIFLDIAIISI